MKGRNTFGGKRIHSGDEAASREITLAACVGLDSAIHAITIRLICLSIGGILGLPIRAISNHAPGVGAAMSRRGSRATAPPPQSAGCTLKGVSPCLIGWVY